MKIIYEFNMQYKENNRSNTAGIWHSADTP